MTNISPWKTSLFAGFTNPYAILQVFMCNRASLSSTLRVI